MRLCANFRTSTMIDSGSYPWWSLFPLPAASLAMRTAASKTGSQSPLEEPCAETNAEPSLGALRLNDKYEARLADQPQHLFVNSIHMALVDQTNHETFLLQAPHCVEASVQGVAICDNISEIGGDNKVISAKLKCIIVAEEGLAIAVENLGHLRPRAVQETQSIVPENCIQHLLHLADISGEEELGLGAVLGSKAIVSEKIVLTEVAHVI